MNIQICLTREGNLSRFRVPKGTVVTLDLDAEYLPWCVAGEVYENNARTPMEAKKAQAVAARTYAAAHARRGTLMDDTANFQAFVWRDPRSIPNCVQATRETAGQVLTYGGELITAWYSNSNGGRTRRSDEAWSTYKPWTVAKDDAWDRQGRAKWGECKASHGVGMSQIGAAYAASVGVQCRDILAFYYPGTITTGDETMINASDLCAYARGAVGGGYCWGADGQISSPSYRQELARRAPDRADKLLGVCAKWDGKKVWDCSGLFRGAWRALSKYKSGGATTIYKTWCTETGAIGSMPDLPGLAMFKAGSSGMAHIGLYVGGGVVIDARGSEKGVLIGPRVGYPWTHWGRLAEVDYGAVQEDLPMRQAVWLGTVKTKTGGGIGIWNMPDTVIKRTHVPEGGIVEMLGVADGRGWAEARYNGVMGWADTQYLRRLPDAPPDEDDPLEDVDDPEGERIITVPMAELAQVLDLLEALDMQTTGRVAEVAQIMRAWIGGGA